MASITEISVEHIHNAYESIRGNIAVEAFYAVVTGFMAVTLIHRLYTVYREVQSNEDGTPTMKDYMNLVWQYVFCIAAVALDRKSTRLNSSHIPLSRMPSSA